MVSRQLSAGSGGRSVPPAGCAGSEAEHALPRRIGARYDAVAELGRGGMARVYRAIDTATGRELALKQLIEQPDAQRSSAAAVLFEREFHTLVQLSHPRVIEVYDYGLDTSGPYYTMELLDGGDLRERAPLPWREACELCYDVCSSLALLHSRRLVHRDVSPRNVRCTRDGHAKLIDFGAMLPMGASGQCVGTPPFVAPEAVHGAALDARADLFSLGCTLYHALTGRFAYPARSFAQLLQCWSNRPPLASALVADVPEALDRLVSSLMSLEAALRPRSAFEVMQHLATIAGIEREEPLSVAKAYLATPSLVGRDAWLSKFREQLVAAQQGRGSGILISAEPGMGRSRMLDTCTLHAKMQGACVLRAGASAGPGSDFAAVRVLAEQLLVALPEVAVAAARAASVFETLFQPESASSTSEPVASAEPVAPTLKRFERSPRERPALSRALLSWFMEVSERQPLVIALDDADRIDEGAMLFFAQLVEHARGHAILALASVDPTAHTSAPILSEELSSRCITLGLPALDLAETELLLSSLFGDVPNVALLSARIQSVAAGNPRKTMELAQHLVDRGVIVYDAGSFSLPERLSADELPASVEAARRARIKQLSPLSRSLAEAQALTQHDAAFTRDDYALLEPHASAQRLDDALTELVVEQIVTSDGRTYALADRSVIAVLESEIPIELRGERHRSVAMLYERTGRPAFAAICHLLLAGEHELALDRMLAWLGKVSDRVEFMGVARMAALEIGHALEHALELSCALRRPAREQSELRRWLTMMSVAADEELYWQAAPAWRAQLERDSGLSRWRALSELAAGPRLKQALEGAAQQYAASPEHERVYTPNEAIRLLIHYVAISIAIGARTLDARLLRTLPELLEPFAPLSPLLSAIWNNALATRESNCHRQLEQARARWIQVYEQLGRDTTTDPQLVGSIRYAIAFGVGFVEAAMGIAAAVQWAEILDGEPLQQVNAMYLRKIVRLQQGDLEGAERCRKQAELFALQTSSRQMFTNLLTVEINVHAAAWDLTGVKQIAARIEPLAACHRGWLPFRHLAEGHYRRLLGDLEAACRAYERCLALASPDPSDPERSINAWPFATASYVETLVSLDRADEAKMCAQSALAECQRRGMGASSHDVARALALAEAKLGEHGAATTRLDLLIAEQLALRVTGLNLGASYEARARVAIWAGHRVDVERFGRLTAEQYRHGRGSPLGARYERLMEEARGAGVPVLPPLSPFESSMFGTTELGTLMSAVANIASVMDGAGDSVSRAQRALTLLCEMGGASAGHLYLVEERALRLVATEALKRPDRELERLTQELWRQQYEDSDPDTALLSESLSAEPDGAAELWTDVHGTCHRPMLVSGKVNGVIVHAGVALLVPRAGERVHIDPLMVAALADFLLRVGDSRPA